MSRPPLVRKSHPPKTMSFKTYTEQLADYAESRQLLQQAEYWRRLNTMKQKVFLTSRQVYLKLLQKRNTVSFTLTESETDALLKDVHSAYNTDTQDMLLASAVLAVQKWSPRHALKIALEGHGRQSEQAGADISRTVGWFTSIYPVLVRSGVYEPLEEYEIRTLKTVKDTLRRIPDKGNGYGVLKYLTPPKLAGMTFGKHRRSALIISDNSMRPAGIRQKRNSLTRFSFLLWEAEMM